MGRIVRSIQEIEPFPGEALHELSEWADHSEAVSVSKPLNLRFPFPMISVNIKDPVLNVCSITSCEHQFTNRYILQE